MDPPSFVHHHRRGAAHHHLAAAAAAGGAARSRYDPNLPPYPHYFPENPHPHPHPQPQLHPHPHLRFHHHPPPLPPPPPSPPTVMPPPQPHYLPVRPQPYGNYHPHRRQDELRAEEMRRHAAQLEWEEHERRRLSLRPLSPPPPPPSRKRQRWVPQDCDLESTSSSGPPGRTRGPRRPRLSYEPELGGQFFAPEDEFRDRNPRQVFDPHGGGGCLNYPAQDADFLMKNGNKGKRKMVRPSGSGGSPRSFVRRTPQKGAISGAALGRVSVWQRIEENPSFLSSPPRPPPPQLTSVVVEKEADSPSKSEQVLASLKESTSVMSMGCNEKSPNKAGIKTKKGGKKKTIASVVSIPPSARLKDGAVKKAVPRPPRVQNDAEEITSSSKTADISATPVGGTKRVKKIVVIKRVVKKSGAEGVASKNKKVRQSGNQTVSEKKDNTGINSDACEEEEGEIRMDCIEKNAVSLEKSVNTLDAAEDGGSADPPKEDGEVSMDSSEKNAAFVDESMGIPNTAEVVNSEDAQKEGVKISMNLSDNNAAFVDGLMRTPNTAEVCGNDDARKEEGTIPITSRGSDAAPVDDSMRTPNTAEVGGNEDALKEEFVMFNGKAGSTGTNAISEFVAMDASNLLSSTNVEGANLAPQCNDPVRSSPKTTTSGAAQMMNINGIPSLPENDFAVLRTEYSSSSALTNSEHYVPTSLTLCSSSYFNSTNSERQHDENHGLIEQKQELDIRMMAKEFQSFDEEKSTAGDDLIRSGVQNWLTLPLTTTIAESEQHVNDDAFIGEDHNVSPILDQMASAGAFTGADHSIRPILDQVGSDDAFTGEDCSGKPVLDQIVSDDSLNGEDHGIKPVPNQIASGHTSSGKDHSTRPISDQIMSDDDFTGQDRSIILCDSNMPPLPKCFTPKESCCEAVDNQSDIILSGLYSANAMNVGQVSRSLGNLVYNQNDSILSALGSADTMNMEPLCSQLSDNPDHNNDNNREDRAVESSLKQDLLSSWIESVVSEAKKEVKSSESSLPSVSSPEKSLTPDEDNRKAVCDSKANVVEKSVSWMASDSSAVPKDIPSQLSLPSSTRDFPRLNHNARHRTWHRDITISSASSSHGSQQPSGLLSKPSEKKAGKIQSSYIRKGNALIRKLATGHPSHSSCSQDAPNKLNKPMTRRTMNFVRRVNSNDFAAQSFERPKTPPLPLPNKSMSCTGNPEEPSSQTLQNHPTLETDKEDPVRELDSGADNPCIRSVKISEASDNSRVVYVKHKSNQLVASLRPQLGDLTNNSMEMTIKSALCTASDLYYKKKKNQIILSASSSDGQNRKDVPPPENSNSDDNRDLMIASAGTSIKGQMNRLDKALQKTNKIANFSHVWTLHGQQSQRKGIMITSHMKALPHILPWKRKLFWRTSRSNRSLMLNKSSLWIVRKLLVTRKRDMIYTVSRDGFSLRKAGVLSIGGSSLKWSRSIERHSKRVNEEATMAVAEVERKKREKRKRQSIGNKGKKDKQPLYIADDRSRTSNHTSSDSRRLSTCDEYIRVSKGNQLVRDPKKVVCMLASEKVRWSLHTVRSRQAKKQQYCQFFTRFGQCKRHSGNCPYIHDPAKVTICTKFLKGLCANANCKLTHKVLPERMPDCSYFLRGLCTNTACPYRHVKVNPNASVCEGFLKGYCDAGDECHKKHSYVCPIFEAKGECPQGTKCKLHHPKKRTKSKKRRAAILQNSIWGRYFNSSIASGSESLNFSPGEHEMEKHQDQFSSVEFGDYISIDVGAGEDDADFDASEEAEQMQLDSDYLDLQTDNLDALIKPIRIMRTARV